MWAGWRAIVGEKERIMRLNRSAGMPMMFVVLVAGGLPSRGSDSVAEATLKGKGLTKVARTYVIEAETPALAKMKEIRAALASYGNLADRQATAEQAASYLAQLDEQKAQLQTNLDALNQQINLQGNTQANNLGRAGGKNSQQQTYASSLINQRAQVQINMAAIDREQKAVKGQTSQGKAKETLDEETKKASEAFKTALAEARPLVDEVTKKYAELEADEEVKTAMIAAKKASIAKVKLGPSDAFLGAVKELDQAERRFLGKTTTAVSKKKAKARR
jgi:hypothetical protein